LKGLPDAIKAVFPNASTQSCIIHQIRNSIKYIAFKDSKEFMKDLQAVYKATSKNIAASELESLDQKWGNKYGIL
jgi:putative transposase